MGGARRGVGIAQPVQLRLDPNLLSGAISPGRTSYYALGVAGRLRGQERIRAILARRLMQSALRVKADLYAAKRLCRCNSGGRRNRENRRDTR